MKVVLENLTKIFPSRNKKSNEEVIAVNNFNFEIPDGKLIGLLGPSAAEKAPHFTCSVVYRNQLAVKFISEMTM